MTLLVGIILGDGDGQNEMNWSMNYLRKFLNSFQEEASSIRVFFPDNTVSGISSTQHHQSDSTPAQTSGHPRRNSSLAGMAGVAGRDCTVWPIFM